MASIVHHLPWYDVPDGAPWCTK